MRTKLALLAAVILGFLAAIGVRHYVEQKESEIKGKAQRVAIIVAREDIMRGSLLRDHMLKAVEVEEIAVSAMHILYTQAKGYIGTPLARRVKAGEPLMKTDFIVESPIGEASASAIESGWRAITIGVDQISGVGGLITPKSRVDIFGTFREQAGGPNVAASVVTRVVARNVEVIAVDNRTALSLPARGPGRTLQTDRGYSSITLHVTTLEAVLLTFAQGAGKLSCALRRTEDVQVKESTPEVTQSQLNEIIAAAARQREMLTQQRSKATTPP
ncbi:MAG TPA: Flp pilus assembly protein CpaB [Planctomycetota bacterium]|nr:Flp pilus assembly protein CpaB [Planctomycetota bacterium]